MSAGGQDGGLSYLCIGGLKVKKRKDKNPTSLFGGRGKAMAFLRFFSALPEESRAKHDPWRHFPCVRLFFPHSRRGFSALAGSLPGILPPMITPLATRRWVLLVNKRPPIGRSCRKTDSAYFSESAASMSSRATIRLSLVRLMPSSQPPFSSDLPLMMRRFGMPIRSASANFSPAEAARSS